MGDGDAAARGLGDELKGRRWTERQVVTRLEEGRINDSFYGSLIYGVQGPISTLGFESAAEDARRSDAAQNPVQREFQRN